MLDRCVFVCVMIHLKYFLNKLTQPVDWTIQRPQRRTDWIRDHVNYFDLCVPVGVWRDHVGGDDSWSDSVSRCGELRDL